MFSAEKDETSSGRECVYSLDFFLDMSSLGEIHISVQVGPGSIRGGFQVEKEEVREFLNAQLVELKKLLSDQGYSDISLSCRRAGRELRYILKERIEERGRYKSVSLVDVNV